jgi:hypothetical protein
VCEIREISERISYCRSVRLGKFVSCDGEGGEFIDIRKCYRLRSGRYRIGIIDPARGEQALCIASRALVAIREDMCEKERISEFYTPLGEISRGNLLSHAVEEILQESPSVVRDTVVDSDIIRVIGVGNAESVSVIMSTILDRNSAQYAIDSHQIRAKFRKVQGPDQRGALIGRKRREIRALQKARKPLMGSLRTVGGSLWKCIHRINITILACETQESARTARSPLFSLS